MHILFISQYYHPEIGAASERITGLTSRLAALGYGVTVITGFPNYPSGREYPGYKKRLFSVGSLRGVKVVRTWLFTGGGPDALSRLLNYLSFMIGSVAAGFRAKDIDCVIATSGPIFAGLSGYLVSRMKNVPFILDVRDIWPERIYAGTGIRRGWGMKTLEKLEMLLYRNAAKIIAVTNGVKANIVSKGISTEKITVITNGVDTNIFDVRPRNKALAEKSGIGHNTFTVIYAGTLGLLQDLDIMAEAARRLKDYSDIVFLIVGGGPRKKEFVDNVRKHGLRNVVMIPPVSAAELNDYINLSDIGINANTDHPHNDMAIPVKMFPYMACSKPVVLANTGEIAGFVERHRIGKCVPPGDAGAFTSGILEFYGNRDLLKQCGANGYTLVRERFSMESLTEELLRVINSRIS